MINSWNTYNKLRNGLLLMAIPIIATVNMRAEEGMWIPLLIEKYHITAMQEAGLKLTAGDIYSINRDCLKDAVVIFNGGCTGEMISGEGLLLTNHHCGESVVQRASSVEHDYLTNGYWAMSGAEELPARSVSVTFLRYMKEVTAEMEEGITQGMEPEERERRMELNMGNILRNATTGTYLEGEVVPFYYGNVHYLFVYEVFRDVRLVGAPPVSIGNFGADSDNWIWPRHSGDFMLFRVYADAENRPAYYDPANRPYRPRKHLEINAGGIKEGDFTMILGYPGSTSQYLHSEAIRLQMEKSMPLRIRLRTSRLEIMDHYMRDSDRVRIQYTTRYRGVSNSWKKWQGVIQGLNRMNVLEQKVREEAAFTEWVNAEGERQLKYDGILEQFSQRYAELNPYAVAVDLVQEAVEPLELFRQVSRLRGMMVQGTNVETLKRQVEQFYGEFHMPLEWDLFAAMMKACYEEMPDPFLPAFLHRASRKFRGDFRRFAERTSRRSLFGDRSRVMKLLELYSSDPEGAIEILMGDPVTRCLQQLSDPYLTLVVPVNNQLQLELEKCYGTYMRALLEMGSDRILYADANSTMRLTYGKVEGYQPAEGIIYDHATTLEGIVEKGRDRAGDAAFRIPDRLMELYEAKDYGMYGVNGTMPVCFIASNHTSGGNSGSPVLDAEGRLIGLNFDRNWEGTMSDYYYDGSICRNIAVDIRYVLFIVDKFAGAGYLIDELKITR